MNETSSPFDQNELSDNDLAVLRAFENAEELVVKKPVSGISTQKLPPLDQALVSPSPHPPLQPTDTDISDNMLVLFVTEADGDIAIMREALDQLEHNNPADSASLVKLQRTAHKLKGTAETVGYEHISTIAHDIELLVKLAQGGTITYVTALVALAQAVRALEATLYSVGSARQESSAPLTELEATYNKLNIDVRSAGHISNRAASIPPVHVDTRDLEQLVLHIEELAEQRASLENAQAQVEAAQQELHAAQLRLLHLETLLSPVSSALKIAKRDEGTDDELLARSLAEALADVVTASAQLRTALEQLSRALHKQMTQTTILRSDALLLLPRFQGAVQGLLVRVASQHVVVPFAHVERIAYKESIEYEPLYVLNTLLGFPPGQPSTETARPVLLLRQNNRAVQVDEVLGEVEVVMKPLAAHLQRPGIAGAATDGKGNVLLILDVPALVSQRMK